MYRDDYEKDNEKRDVNHSRKETEDKPIVLGGEVDEKVKLYSERVTKEEKDQVINNSRNKKPKKKKQRSRFSYFIVALVAAIIGGLVSQFVAPYIFISEKDEQQVISDKDQGTVINTTDDITTVSAVAKSAISSVVGITTVELRQDLFFMREVEGVGSGVIIDSNGYILTNSHVVGDGNARSLEVLFDDGDKVPGEVLWSDRALDLAVVKVDKKGLPAVKLGDSDDLEIGEIAVAIGNPLGLEFQRSVTSGIVSGLNRTISVEGILMEDLIQTDASINHGNSGGPLLNSKAEVVGINTVKVSSAEGLGFSIPINAIKPILKQVIETGGFETVSLGISGLSIEEYGDRVGIKLQEKEGLVVIEILKDSPAAKAGIKTMDIITKIDGNPIKSRTGLKKRLYDYKSGDTAKLTVIRDSEEIVVEVVFK